MLKNGERVDYAELFQGVRARLGGSTGSSRYFGGFRSGPWHRSDQSWRVFGGYRFMLPQFELSRRGDQLALACLFVRGREVVTSLDAILSQLHAMKLPVGHEDGGLPHPLGRLDTPGLAGWQHQVGAALERIRAGDLQKVVLARRTCFEFDQALDAFRLLRRLKEATEGCYHFCGSHAGRVAFVGASPERLYRREGRTVSSEAVAGTRPRGSSEAEDERLGRDLVHSEKDRQEHRLVIESVREALGPLCETLNCEPETSLLKLDRVQHLIRRFDGRLKPGVDDAEIMARLHPTPAVGGYPRDPAQRLISELEDFDRGWYTAPVGWVSGDSAEFAVALRCGVLAGTRMCLFSGAGIVKASDPSSEWQEVESKIGTFLKVLTSP